MSFYNEERKNAFIQERTDTVKISIPSVKALFNEISLFEARYEKDCCEWTTTEIINFLKYINSGSIEGLRYKLSTLKIYTDWCMNHLFVSDNQNHYLEITSNILMDCVNPIVIKNLYLSYDQLQSMLKSLINPSDQFIILALYEGINGFQCSEITGAKIGMIDKDKKEMHTAGDRIIPVSDQLIHYAEQSVDEYQYYTFSGDDSTVILLHGDEDLIVKYFPNRTDTSRDRLRRGIHTRLKRILDYCGLYKRINIKNIMESGRMHQIEMTIKKYKMSGIEEFFTHPELVRENEYIYGSFRVRKDYIKIYNNFIN